MMHGVLLLDKPERMTSHAVVLHVRRLLGERRVGHAGTLDPFATGLLVLLIGDATKLSQYLSFDDKAYQAVCRWGTATDTADRTGAVIESIEASVPPVDVLAESLRGFLGESMQVPPMYSAKKQGGRPLYEVARKGQTVQRDPVPIRIDELNLLDRTEQGFSFFVRCGKGTYVRTLAEDLCRSLGGVGHLSELRRTASGGFHLEDAIDLGQLEAIEKPNSAGIGLISMEAVCARFPAVRLDDTSAEELIYGKSPMADQVQVEEPVSKETLVRLVDGRGELLALARTLAPLPPPSTPSVLLRKAFCIERNFSAKKAEKKRH